MLALQEIVEILGRIGYLCLEILNSNGKKSFINYNIRLTKVAKKLLEDSRSRITGEFYTKDRKMRTWQADKSKNRKRSSSGCSKTNNGIKFESVTVDTFNRKKAKS